MGFNEKFRDFFGFGDQIDEDEFDENETEFEEEEQPRPKRRQTSVIDNDYSATNESAAKSKYVNIHTGSKLSVVLVKPESFAEATEIADHLNNKRTVVLNLESASKDVSRRLVDFLSGVAYANQGVLKRVANCTYIVTPFNVDVMGEVFLEETESSGMYI